MLTEDQFVAVNILQAATLWMAGHPGSKPNVLLLENDIRNAYKEQGNRTMSELTRDWLAGK